MKKVKENKLRNTIVDIRNWLDILEYEATNKGGLPEVTVKKLIAATRMATNAVYIYERLYRYKSPSLDLIKKEINNNGRK